MDSQEEFCILIICLEFRSDEQVTVTALLSSCVPKLAIIKTLILSLQVAPQEKSLSFSIKKASETNFRRKQYYCDSLHHTRRGLGVALQVSRASLLSLSV